MERELFVYVDMPGQAVLAGRLWTRGAPARGKRDVSLRHGLVEHPDRFPLEPALPLALLRPAIRRRAGHCLAAWGTRRPIAGGVR